ncbi:MAG: metallophosphoesterase [Candidatus Izemoplasmatales bacterium]|nr:metallophosphoesterase [Candidatus Izemoplasmatales bacterium]
MRKIIALIISVFNFSLFLAMRSIWSGIEGMFGISWIQYIIFGLLTGLAITAVILFFAKPKSIVLLIIAILGGVLSIALFYMLYLGIDALTYIARSFGDILFWTVVIGFGVFMIFYYPKTRYAKCVVFKFVLLGSMLVMILVVTFNLHFCFITNQPVVFAVEEEYQIVWTTSSNATGTVTIDGTDYHDLYAGSLNSETTVHKVIVPMTILDAAEEYTISSTQIIYRGPYSGITGTTVNQTYCFYPVDTMNGLDFYTLSDTHDYTSAASETGSYFGDNLDFLVMAGDISSHLEEPADIERILEIAHNITKGSHPVIYARGNHETKGNCANILYKYVGSKDEKFFYTVHLADVFAIVLDLGEDHNDDWWEYYDTANYDEYRNEQTAFIMDTIVKYGFDTDTSIKFRLGISHMPVNYVITEKSSLPYGGDNMFLADIKAQWTALLNTLVLDLMVSGHHHQLMPITTDIPANTTLYYDENYNANNTTKAIGYRTDSDFATFIVSRRSDVQTPTVSENLFGQKFSGLAVSLGFWAADTKIIIRYTNTDKTVVSGYNPFTGEAFTEFNIIPWTWSTRNPIF